MPSAPAWLFPALLVLLGLLLGIWIARLRVRWRTARSRRMGTRGEKRALRLLRRAGYTIVDTQVTYRGRVMLDDDPVEFWVFVDAVVEIEGQRFVAELKGGAEAGSISTRATRRQLLEYAWLSETDGVVLVDAVAGRIHRVRFGGLGEGRERLRASA